MKQRGITAYFVGGPYASGAHILVILNDYYCALYKNAFCRKKI